MNDINQKIQAAQLLGLEIEEEYKIIENGFFCVITIKGKDQSYPIPMQKNLVIQKLQSEKNNLRKRLEKIDKDITKIKDMKC